MTINDDEFARAFMAFLTHMSNRDSAGSAGTQLGGVVGEHLGADPQTVEMVRVQYPAHRMADLDVALEHLVGQHGGRWVGIQAGNAEHADQFLDLLTGRLGPADTGPVAYTRTPVGPAVSRRVVRVGILLTHAAGTPLALLVRGANPHYGRPEATVEMLGDPDAAGTLQQQIDELMNEHSVLRGQVLSFRGDDYGAPGGVVTFLARPRVSAEQVILPDGVRERVIRHVVDIGRQSDAIRAAGQHLKRGVLLYGPPGTGKTHLVRHVLSLSPGTTAVLLTGRTLHLLPEAASLARTMQPAIIVMEDCDLVAEERGFHSDASLFETLEAMDGLSGDADVTFLLTTNRPDLLERALVERPGRVDLAVAIDRPDLDARVRLLRLYAASLIAAGRLSEAAIRQAAQATEGVTASFTRELVRRCVVTAAVEGRPVGDADLAAELEHLLSDQQTLTRSILGGAQPDDDRSGGFEGPGPGLAPRGTFGYFGPLP